MLTIWLDGWFSSAFNIIELIKNNPDKKPIKVIASHHKDMGYKVLCDEFYLREDFPENDNDMNYKEWAIDFAKKHNVDIFFPRRYYSTLAKSHKDFVYVYKDEIKECKLVLPGIFDEYNSGFTSLFEDKMLTQTSLGDWSINLKKYQNPCWELNDVKDIEDFRMTLISHMNFLKQRYSFKKFCIKPIKGTGAQGFRILDYPFDAWKIRDIIQRSGQKFMIMPYLEGNEISIDFLKIDNDVLMVPRIKNKKNRIQEIAFNEVTNELCKDIKESGIPDVLETVGNVQFMEHDGKYYLLEVNPRMSGGIYLDSLAGVNFPYLMVKKILGEEIKIPKVKSCKVVNIERGVRVE